MCGRYSLLAEPDELARLLGLERPRRAARRYNIAPSQPVLALVWDSDANAPALRTLRWGLAPHWASSFDVSRAPINARCETVASKPTFRESFAQRRCLLPADGFYEWQRRGGVKQPYRITLKGGGVFGLAGVWDRWVSPQDEPYESCAVITTDANGPVSQLHDRMPVILGLEEAVRWLSPATPVDEADGMLRPLPDDAVTVYPVKRSVNRADHDAPDCIEPADGQGERQLGLFD